jgi:hypothetical protein
MRVGRYIQDVKTKTKKPSPTKKPAAAAPGRQAGPKDKDLETIHNEVVAKTEVEHIEDWVGVDCPYCGEGIDVHVNSEQDGQTMFEDCGVCCRPVQLHIHVEEGELQVEAHRS